MAKHQKIKIISDATCRMADRRTNGAAYVKGKAACGSIILDNLGNILDQRTKYLGECTVPQAEYLGLIFALDVAVEFGRHDLEVWMDSELVIRQMVGDYCIRSEAVKILFDQVKRRELRFLGRVDYFHHNRGSFWARQADALANAEYSRNHTG